MNRLPGLYAIVDASFGDPVRIADQLFSAGVRMVQLRNKGASSRLLLDQSVRILRNAPPDAIVAINDRADVARIAGAGAVHVGQDDLPPASVRRIVGDAVLVGLSTHDEGQALAAASDPVDYVAVGPIFETSTKTDSSPAIGIDCLRRICRLVDRPVVAIGGIRLSNVEAVVRAGAASVAVASDLIGVGRIPGRAVEFLRKLDALGRV